MPTTIDPLLYTSAFDETQKLKTNRGHASRPKLYPLMQHEICPARRAHAAASPASSPDTHLLSVLIKLPELKYVNTCHKFFCKGPRQKLAKPGAQPPRNEGHSARSRASVSSGVNRPRLAVTQRPPQRLVWCPLSQIPLLPLRPPAVQQGYPAHLSP